MYRFSQIKLILGGKDNGSVSVVTKINRTDRFIAIYATKKVQL